MSHPARLSLRAPPHLPFVQGYPGIPGYHPDPSSGGSGGRERKSAAVHGTLELRVGTIPVKAKWVRVELRKFESLPPSFPSSSSSSEKVTWEHVGDIQTLWQPPVSATTEWAPIETADFKFSLPLPLDIPPSIELPKGTGIRYELVAALCYRQKGGMFKKESSPIIKISEPLQIIKHDLHSSWPIYNDPESRTIQASNGQINLTVSRPSTAFGAGDHLNLTATLKSARPQPFKLKGFECTLHEVITSIPHPPENNGTKSKKSKSLLVPIIKSRPVASVRVAVDETVGLGGEKSSRIDMPVERALVTVKTARSLKLTYELEIQAVTDVIRDKVVMAGMQYTVGPFMRSHAQQAVRDIGYVATLCPEQVDPSISQSHNLNGPLSNRVNGIPPTNSSLQPKSGQTVQGFIPRHGYRRESSATSTTETTVTTAAAGNDFGFGSISRPESNGNAGNANRAYATMPTSNQRRSEVAFPTPQPAPARPRSIDMMSPSTPISPAGSITGSDRYNQSDAGQGEDMSRRYSAMTTATFGRWDAGLKNAIHTDKEEKLTGEGSDLSSQVTAKAPSTITPGPTQASAAPTTPRLSTTSGGPSRVSSSKTPPSSYPFLSADQEKRRQKDLYEAARMRAVNAQQATGASLVRLGLADSSVTTAAPAIGEGDGDPPPPEYAPPRPDQPSGRYVPPPKSIEEYTTPPNASTATFSSPQMSAPSSPETFTATLANTSGTTEIPPPSEYMTAAEEKELQRRRYEVASRRVVSTGSGPSPEVFVTQDPRSASPAPTPTSTSISQHPSRQSTSSQSIFVSRPSSTHALIEKEQMRRYYEAQDRVAQARSNDGHDNLFAGAGGSGSGGVGPSSSQSQGKVITPSASASARNGAIDEKEQMRRYYEAQDRVAQARSNDGHGSPSASGSGSGSGSGGPLQGRVVTPSTSINVVNGSSAINEKEQMRRFYEAQDRVAQAQKRYSGGSGMRSASASASTSLDGHINAIASGSAPSAGAARKIESSPYGGQGVGGGVINEKEQMRRYYEAQDRVAQARNSSPSLSASNSGSHTPVPSPQNPKNPSSDNTKGSPTISAAEEKAQMKRYYQAIDAVERAKSTPVPYAGGSGSSSPLRKGSIELAPPIEPPSFDQATSIYPSAEEEKDQMRRRYQLARTQSSTPKTPQTPQAHRSGAYSPPTSPSSSPATSVFVRDPTIKAGKARALTTSPTPDACAETMGTPPPPPPLPARPPQDYINLLSP